MITLDQKLVEYLLNWAPGGWPIGNFILCAAAILLSIVFSGLIGLERERGGGTTGLRTHILVGLGSCIVMIISIYGFPALLTMVDGTGESNRDVARLASAVVSGIGFLGTGAIIYSGGGIKGLTTASTIWLSMALGIACGSFNFIIAIFAEIIILVCMYLFRKVEKNIVHNLAYVVVYANPDSPILTTVLDKANNHGLEIIDLGSEIVKNPNEEHLEVSFRVKFKKRPTSDEDLFTFIRELEKCEHVSSVQLVHKP